VAADRRFIGKRGCNLDPFSEQHCAPREDCVDCR
jgi:hypothetical protein